MEYTKSKMSGMVSDYQKMYDAIKNWNEASPPTKRLEDGTVYNEPGHYIYGMGWAIDDMGYHGWTGDAAKNEWHHYEEVNSFIFLSHFLSHLLHQPQGVS